MKIIHIDMTGPYTIGATYQENILPAQQAKLGHDVQVWVTTYEWAEGKENQVAECCDMLPEGVLLKRIEFTKIINSFITRKVRLCKGIYESLEKESPDIIMVHDGQTACTVSICKYVKNHPKTKLIADSHTDYLNSATSFLSKTILHKVFYKYLMKKLYKYTEKLYCISEDVKNSITDLYNLDVSKMEVLPLGGLLLEDSVYEKNRHEIRKKLCIPDDGINLIHSGKMPAKKDTFNLLKAFEKMDRDNLYLTLIGAVSDDLLSEINRVKEINSNLNYISWVDGDGLIQYLCGGDIYVLPRAQSATVQSAMCCRCAIEVYPYANYKSFRQNDVCYAISTEELMHNIEMICDNKELLQKIKKESYDFASNKLDYSKQAEYIMYS